jgi:membrane protein
VVDEQTALARDQAELADRIDRLPRWLRAVVLRLMRRWPGRIALRSAAALRRIEIFDRAMTIAAQFFTSVFPLLILLALWLGPGGTRKVSTELDLPAQTQNVVQKAIEGNTETAFGLVGLLVVLVSGTSLSRALTRAFATIWLQPRPKSRLRSAWRWVAVLTTLALFLVVARVAGTVADGVPPSPTGWRILLTFLVDFAVAIGVPWLLLEGKVPTRQIVPGALLFGSIMLWARPVAHAFLPHALDSSASHYGSIGVAFTYISYLYLLSWVFLATMTVGQVLASDEGSLGGWIRGDRGLFRKQPPRRRRHDPAAASPDR